MGSEMCIRDRTTTGAVHVVDKRPFVARPLLCFTDPHGRFNVWSAVVKSGTNGSDATEDHDGAAAGLHHFLPVVPIGSGAVLVGEQRSLNCAAVGDYAQNPGRRQQDLSDGIPGR